MTMQHPTPFKAFKDYKIRIYKHMCEKNADNRPTSWCKLTFENRVVIKPAATYQV